MRKASKYTHVKNRRRNFGGIFDRIAELPVQATHGNVLSIAFYVERATKKKEKKITSIQATTVALVWTFNLMTSAHMPASKSKQVVHNLWWGPALVEEGKTDTPAKLFKLLTKNDVPKKGKKKTTYWQGNNPELGLPHWLRISESLHWRRTAERSWSKFVAIAAALHDFKIQEEEGKKKGKKGSCLIKILGQVALCCTTMYKQRRASVGVNIEGIDEKGW